MRTQAEIGKDLRDHFPLVFGTADPIARSTFRRAYKRLVRDTREVAEPYLRRETLHYQSLVLYTTLALLVIKLFKLDKISFIHGDIVVDRSFYVFYTILIALLVSLFLIKAWMDAYRAELLRQEKDSVLLELSNRLAIAAQRIRIQEHYWLEVFDVIGRTYETYSNATARAIGIPDSFRHVSMNVISLDRGRLSNEFASEVDQYDKYLAAVKVRVGEDEGSFKVEAGQILAKASQSEHPQPGLAHEVPDSYSEIVKIFDAHLRPWFDARNSLATEAASVAVSQLAAGLNADTTALNRLIGREHRRRFVYAAIEICAPAAWAIGAVVYVWLRPV